MIPGKGVLVWANGKRYEGYWENGVPQGKGMFTFGSGSGRVRGRLGPNDHCCLFWWCPLHCTIYIYIILR